MVFSFIPSRMLNVFENLAQVEKKTLVSHLVGKLGYVVCQKMKNGCSMDEYLLMMKT